MAKRFTDTEKYKDPWFRKLSPKHKILFLFMCDDCNHAGIWKENFDAFNIYYGMQADHKDMKAYGDKVIKVDSDTYLIKSFIKFQYGNLNPQNKAHFGVIRALTYANIDYSEYVAPLKPLPRCTGIGIGEGIGAGIGVGTGVGTQSKKDEPGITTDQIPF